MTTVVRNIAITDTPLANKRVALKRLRHIRFIEDFTNSYRCANQVYAYNSFFTQDIEIKFSVLELYSNNI